MKKYIYLEDMEIVLPPTHEHLAVITGTGAAASGAFTGKVPSMDADNFSALSFLNIPQVHLYLSKIGMPEESQ